MRLKQVFMFLLLMAFGAGLAAQVPRPTKDPKALTEGQKARFQEAVSLHDTGRNAEAAAAFQAVAEENPESPEALLEESLCWYAAGEYEKALGAALGGMEFKSRVLGRFYSIAAESHYQKGRAAEAVPFYQAAVAVEPDNADDYYELGVAYATLKRMEEAREALKAAVALAPARPDPHYALGVLWSAQGYKVPALLALCRFLVLEPETERAKGVLKAVSDSLDEMGGTFGAAGPLRSAPDNAEGDFTSAIGAVSTAWKAAREDQGVDNWTRVTRSIGTLFDRLSQPDSAWRGSFAASFYAPYFSSIAAHKLTDPFCAHIFRAANSDLVDAYIKGHSDKLYEFLKWSEGYRWPKPAGLAPAAAKERAPGATPADPTRARPLPGKK